MYYNLLFNNVVLFILNVVSSNTTAPHSSISRTGHDIIFIKIDTKKETVLNINDWFIDFYLILPIILDHRTSNKKQGPANQ